MSDAEPRQTHADGRSPSGDVDVLPAERDEPIEDPAELVRVGTMLARLSGELRGIDLDASSIERLRDLDREVRATLEQNLDDDLVAELRRLVPRLDAEEASETGVKLGFVQLVAWLEGLFQGIQMTAVGQQLRQRLEQAQTPADTSDGRGSYL